ncbi:SGNH/GDSL hydrolase family protein [Tahibacter soli]|uniref:SGNH/GDSL hydrolase family protein n=1 Tax=Tahibacter soli TaxID=2983605 RepID=A0A9X3YSQ8_9GAMM|nr:SGNH/GDSL hydrolase family protein [Tahibacter soli]MDC8015706.1 SGNH/GDSL hydrolase family protein [Tahibacter soli]
MRSFLAAFVFALASMAAFADAPVESFADDIARFVAADRAAMPAPGGVVFVGSSSIRFWDTLERDFPFVHIVKRGFGGSTLADATRYADRIVIPYVPSLVVLYAGDNDLAAGHTARQVFDDYVAFVARVRRDRPAQKIAFVAIKPSPARAALTGAARDANERIRRYAERDAGLFFVDVFAPMLGADGTPRTELFGPDGLHLNADGYALWRALLEPVLRRPAK